MRRRQHAVFILFILIVFISPVVFASLMDFKVIWIVNTEEDSKLEILKYSTSAAWTDFDNNDNKIKTITPVNDSVMSEVCRVRFTTNKGGRRELSFTATPLEDVEDNTNKVGYTLVLSNDGDVQFLEVYPEHASDTVSVIMYLPFTIGYVFSDVLVDAIFSSLDVMVVGNYKSTITIELVSDT